MGFQRMGRDTFTYWVERRIKEAYLKDKIRDLSVNKSRTENGASPIHGSFWTLFKSGIKTA